MLKLNKSRSFEARCPECDHTLRLDVSEVEVGGFVDCDRCWQLLEIVSVAPLRLALAAFDDVLEFDEDD